MNPTNQPHSNFVGTNTNPHSAFAPSKVPSFSSVPSQQPIFGSNIAAPTSSGAPAASLAVTSAQTAAAAAAAKNAAIVNPKKCPKNMVQHWRFKPQSPVEITLVKPPNYSRRPRRHSSPSIDNFVHHWKFDPRPAQTAANSSTLHPNSAHSSPHAPTPSVANSNTAAAPATASNQTPTPSISPQNPPAHSASPSNSSIDPNQGREQRSGGTTVPTPSRGASSTPSSPSASSPPQFGVHLPSPSTSTNTTTTTTIPPATTNTTPTPLSPFSVNFSNHHQQHSFQQPQFSSLPSSTPSPSPSSPPRSASPPSGFSAPSLHSFTLPLPNAPSFSPPSSPPSSSPSSPRSPPSSFSNKRHSFFPYQPTPRRQSLPSYILSDKKRKSLPNCFERSETTPYPLSHQPSPSPFPTSAFSPSPLSSAEMEGTVEYLTPPNYYHKTARTTFVLPPLNTDERERDRERINSINQERERETERERERDRERQRQRLPSLHQLIDGSDEEDNQQRDELPPSSSFHSHPINSSSTVSPPSSSQAQHALNAMSISYLLSDVNISDIENLEAPEMKTSMMAICNLVGSGM